MTEATGDQYREQRLANMRELQRMGYDPFGSAFARTGTLAEIRAAFAAGREVSAAGRIATMRDMGKSRFMDLRDGSDRFQIYLRRDALGEEGFAAAGRLDLGDHIGVTGALFTTRSGEQTIEVRAWRMMAKALRPLPEKWHGLKDVEARYRQRYLDLACNPETREIFARRSRAAAAVRAFLNARGFQEVETPMMQPQAGGAAARPFATHYAALNADMFLRIAPELYLKRLLVGGCDRIFELNRCFRNEGLSRTHNPEFTMLEIYEAYGDVQSMKRLVTDMVAHLADTVYGGRAVRMGETTIDLNPPWREVAYRELLEETMGAGWHALPADEARRRAAERGVAAEPGWGLAEISHEIYEKVIERTLVQPTFVTRLPAAIVPLARACPDDASCADVFELVIGGQEIAPGYTELNDPLEQRRRLEGQAGADREKVDEDFLEALEHGMPPAGGMGVGIDRLLMVLSGAEAIRDVILFPQLRPRKEP